MKKIHKNEVDIVKFRHNEVNFEAAFDDHQNIRKYSYNKHYL